MNPRLFTCAAEMPAREDLFWALLDDLWHFKEFKVSPLDPRFQPTRRPLRPRDAGPQPTDYETIKPLASRRSK